MNIISIHHSPERKLAAAINIFEHEFVYPLGSDRHFRISHGDDLTSNAWYFFCTLGNPAVYLVAERHGRILGSIGAALRHIVQPNGTSTVGLYLGDLKVSAGERGGLVLYRLFHALKTWSLIHAPCGVLTAYSIVMDGTSITPESYSGRLGFPAFKALGTSTIVWLHTTGEVAPRAAVQSVSPLLGQAAFLTFAQGLYHLPQVTANGRSRLSPRWLMSSDSQACGCLEDTLLCKRLWTTADEEMRSAHLSHVAFSDIHSGLALVDVALAHAAQAGYPMLFLTLPTAMPDDWRRHFGNRLRSVSTATIFGTADTLPPGPWLINTAEI